MKWMRQQEGFADPLGFVGKLPEAVAPVNEFRYYLDTRKLKFVPDLEVCAAAHSARKGGSSALGELTGYLLLQEPQLFGSITRFVL